ncbi:MAG TPA: DUF1080 domain-containing protein [Candidatus Paceibacterota bacterium]|nr:DUF1080 domain-containing protein [Candidatus Paceibacterota bacterium]
MNMQLQFINLVVATTILAAASFAMGAEPAKEKHYGYTDTPMLPGTPWHVHDSGRPLPPVVDPGPATPPVAPPSDAVVLFDGKDLSQWQDIKDPVLDDGVINVKKNGQISTKQEFGDCQLHVEWQTPAQADGDAMNWGNSGVFLLGKYEVQIIQTLIYADGCAGGIYGQTPPLVIAARKAGEWQTYDIIFTAPKFDGQKLLQPAYVTVIWNGVLVQNHTAALGPMRYREVANYDDKTTRGPVMLQYHGSAVRFRNIWVRPVTP